MVQLNAPLHGLCHPFRLLRRIKNVVQKCFWCFPVISNELGGVKREGERVIGKYVTDDGFRGVFNRLTAKTIRRALEGLKFKLTNWVSPTDRLTHWRRKVDKSFCLESDQRRNSQPKLATRDGSDKSPRKIIYRVAIFGKFFFFAFYLHAKTTGRRNKEPNKKVKTLKSSGRKKSFSCFYLRVVWVWVVRVYVHSNRY